MQVMHSRPLHFGPLPIDLSRTSSDGWQPACEAIFKLVDIQDEVNAPSLNSPGVGRLEIRKPAQRGRFQEPEMGDFVG